MALYAVFGKPILHSLSPKIHNHAFRDNAISAFYLPVEVASDALPLKLAAFQKLGGRGVNLTRPLKEEVLPHLSAASEWVKQAGAANTLVWQDGGWVGDNTDCQALETKVPPGHGGPALILGAGGVARATAAVLASRGYEVWVAARHPSGVVFGEHILTWGERLKPRDWQVVVNATPLGQIHEEQETDWPLPAPGGMAVDWVYRPRRTRFLALAESRGVSVVDGLELLVEQAAWSWVAWFGYRGPVAVMRDAVQEWS
nr:shikimate dehydrogenase [Sulfobacillus harzensis]